MSQCIARYYVISIYKTNFNLNLFLGMHVVKFGMTTKGTINGTLHFEVTYHMRFLILVIFLAIFPICTIDTRISSIRVKYNLIIRKCWLGSGYTDVDCDLVVEKATEVEKMPMVILLYFFSRKNTRIVFYSSSKQNISSSVRNLLSNFKF